MRQFAARLAARRIAQLLGFRAVRGDQWLTVLKEEERNVDWLEMFKLLLRGLFLKERYFKQKLHICVRCPIFDSNLKRCGRTGPTEGRWGCGCFMPFKALFDQGPCWGKANLPESSGVGWDFSDPTEL